MCLAAWAIAQSSRYPWLFASNRDELFSRPAAPLGWWQPAVGPALLSGRDLTAGGTWLGVNAEGRLALVTNVREPGRHDPAALSRGDLVPQWLARAVRPGRPHHGIEEVGGVDRQEASDQAALAALWQAPRNGCNFIAADLHTATAWWCSNRQPGPPQRMGPGLHGLSNAALDTPWPKLLRLKQRLAGALHPAATLPGLVAAAFAALADPAPAPDALLPHTGVPLARERQLSAAFIRIADAGPAVYGTRCSTVVVVEQGAPRRRAHVFERRFDTSGAADGDLTFTFDLPAR